MKKCILVLMLTAIVFSATAKIELAAPFSDGMVLQRGMKVPVWGRIVPEPNSSLARPVTVKFARQAKTAWADPVTGRWKVELDPMEASKSGRTLTVVEETGVWLADLFGSPVDTVEVMDVLVGEVWFASGQSNMECPIWGGSPHYRDGQGAMIVQMTVRPWVRLVKTPRVSSATPKLDVEAVWKPMTPTGMVCEKGARLPSAVGYLFALELADALDVPIGLVDSSWGGTGIDGWTPRSGYEGIAALKDVAAKADTGELWNGMVAAYAPMAIRGLIWYQGCADAHESGRYCDKMHALYGGWSKEFANPGLKLYFVQLAPYGDGWYDMNLAQAKFEREEPNAAMAVVNDVGCLTDIHPNDKRTVARRLALHALRRDYGFDWIVDNSPTLKSWRVDGNRFVLSFNDVREWYLYNTDWSVRNGFEVCGADGVWKAATIDGLAGTEEAGRRHGKCTGNVAGADLVIYADGVKDPVGLRYLFRKTWAGNLYSESALPLGAFEISR